MRQSNSVAPPNSKPPQQSAAKTKDEDDEEGDLDRTGCDGPRGMQCARLGPEQFERPDRGSAKRLDDKKRQQNSVDALLDLGEQHAGQGREAGAVQPGRPTDAHRIEARQVNELWIIHHRAHRHACPGVPEDVGESCSGHQPDQENDDAAGADPDALDSEGGISRQEGFEEQQLQTEG